VSEEPRQLPRRVAVVGLGVMGGSLVRALAGRGGVAVSGWSPDARERAQAADVLTRAPDTLDELWNGADLVVLATPLEVVLELLPRVAQGAPEAVLTDVASLRVPVAERVRELGLAHRFVGSHPMAGSEASGFGAADPMLYQGAAIWLVEEGSGEPARRMVRALWSGVGARPRRIDAAGHDALMARVSHLPQLAAVALAGTLADAGVDPAALGPGGRDMTRLAGSSPEMWRDLLVHAPGDLPELLRRYAARVEELAEALEAGRPEAVVARLEATGRWRTPSRAGDDGGVDA